MEKRRLLLLSNSRNTGQGYLEHAKPAIRTFLTGTIQRVLFIPYAVVTRSYDEYESLVGTAFAEMGYQVESIHHTAHPERAVRHAEAIAGGGGNTFHMLRSLYQAEVLNAIRERVTSGMPYMGWSAGSNVACPTIRTT